MIKDLTKKHVPMNPKWARYSPNGEGKDEYIRFDNGGLLSNLYKVKSKDAIEVFNNRKNYNLQKNLAPFKYYSDGSGRDSYVIHESGGLERNYQTLNSFKLVDILRKREYRPSNTALVGDRKRDGESVERLFITDKQNKHNDFIRNVEKNLIVRLYKSETHKFINNADKKR